MIIGRRLGVFVLCALAGVLAFSGCNSSDDDPVSTELSTYAEDIQDCTPYLGTSMFESWSAWEPETEFTVFYKLFNPSSGMESIYGGVDQVDMYVEIINTISALWDTEGEHDVELDGGEGTVVVNTDVSSVAVPFFGGTVDVDRSIAMTGGSGETAFQLKIAFTDATTEEIMVARYELGDGAEIGAFYGERDSETGVITLWYACVTDDFHAAFKWSGDPDAGTFVLSQYTDAADGWKILAGGDIAGDMAYRARITTGVVTEDYYLTCTIDNIEGDTEPEEGTIINAEVTAPDGTGALAYITEGNASCLGFLDSYPASAEEIVWSEE